jgi:hypothetical protein
MSFETINIHRTLPVINNYVAVPDDSERNAVTRSRAVNAIQGSTSYKVSTILDPYVIELPAQNIQENTPDYYETLRNL